MRSVDAQRSSGGGGARSARAGVLRRGGGGGFSGRGDSPPRGRRTGLAALLRRRLPLAFSWALAATLLGSAPACAEQAAEDPRAAYRAGDYDGAVAGLNRRIRGGSADAADYRLLVRVLGEVGRYEEAEEAARRGIERADRPENLQNALGEVLSQVGRLEEAEQAFEAAIAGGASDRHVARLNLAALKYDRGERDSAMAEFDTFIDLYNGPTRLTSEELAAVAVAVTYLGETNPDLFHDAVRAFGESLEADPGNHDARVRMGALFLAKYNSAEAGPIFQEVLELNPNHPQALLGMARAQEFDGQHGAVTSTEKALSVNPNLVAAHVFLARLRLSLEDYEGAATRADKALEINPRSLEALAVLAAARYLRGDLAGFEEARRRALSLNPRYAELYNTVAELAVQNRRYQEGVDLAREAVALDERSWRGLGLLGLNELRVGRIEEGRLHLEESFERDPFNPWIKNTLDLLDTFSRYELVRTDRFELMIRSDEVNLLAPYMITVAEDAFARITERYGFRPELPVRVEVYPSHADFSVRTVGLAGLGALGVSFGPVLAMDSPAAREKGEFNWGSTLWHELAHTVHLALSRHRMPRWLGEGLAVYEERKAREGWGSDVGLGFLLAYKNDRLLPFSELNNGFVRPSYPQQVAFSYLQASLVCELIEERWGHEALVDLLRAYGEGRSTEEIFEERFGASPKEFDRIFDDYLKERYAGPLDAVGGPGGEAHLRIDAGAPGSAPRGDFAAQLAAGRQLMEQGDHDRAIEHLERAKELFPDYAAPDSPYWYLAVIHRDRGDLARAADELRELTSRNETAYEANLEEARILEELGRPEGAAEALARAIFVYPYEAEVHEKLAELYEDLEDRGRAVRERTAVVALDPVDRAEALYQLALAHFKAGDRASARRQVLRALEVAPNFEAAQELLLRLQPGSGGEGGP